MDISAFLKTQDTGIWTQWADLGGGTDSFSKKVGVGLKGIIVKLAKNLLHFVVLILEK